MASSPDIRWHQRFLSFGVALARLCEAADLAATRPRSSLEQQGLIQAFEFTHELAWHVLKDFLQSRGVAGLYGSRGATREGFAQGLIAAGDEWMAMIEARNRTTPTYKAKTADEISTAIMTRFVDEFTAFQTRFRVLEKSEP